ncbi:hypothetical protein DKG79_11865 [Escherichia fergusonii]|nr:hypothetical protein DKG79_11865 [Escherichia fergusonii]
MLFRFRRVSKCRASGACRATGDIQRIFDGEPQFARAERELLDKTIALKTGFMIDTLTRKSESHSGEQLLLLFYPEWR